MLVGTMLGYVSVVLFGLDVSVAADINFDAVVQVRDGVQNCTCVAVTQTRLRN